MISNSIHMNIVENNSICFWNIMYDSLAFYLGKYLFLNSKYNETGLKRCSL